MSEPDEKKDELLEEFLKRTLELYGLDDLPAKPQYARYVDRLSDAGRDRWIDSMKNRYGGEW